MGTRRRTEQGAPPGKPTYHSFSHREKEIDWTHLRVAHSNLVLCPLPDTQTACLRLVHRTRQQNAKSGHSTFVASRRWPKQVKCKTNGSPYAKNENEIVMPWLTTHAQHGRDLAHQPRLCFFDCVYPQNQQWLVKDRSIPKLPNSRNPDNYFQFATNWCTCKLLSEHIVLATLLSVVHSKFSFKNCSFWMMSKTFRTHEICHRKPKNEVRMEH